MKYKIIVDKQSRTNPSDKKREYVIDIEELRVKGDVYDSLIITKDEDYVMRRLELTEHHVLNILKEPIKQPIEDVNIELFEGENYIYLIDMLGNKFYAEYLINNDFNDNYATRREMNSAIKQSASQIELSVNEKLTNYSTTEEMRALIKLLSDQIILEVSKKVGEDEICSVISQSAEEILLKGNRVIIESDKFTLDKNGNIIATGGTVGGFALSDNRLSANLEIPYNFTVEDYEKIRKYILGQTSLTPEEFEKYDLNGDGRVRTTDYMRIKNIVDGVSSKTGTFAINTDNLTKTLMLKSTDGKNFTSIGVGNISTNLVNAEQIYLDGHYVPDIEHGYETITPSAPNTPTGKSVSFTDEFSSTPDIITSANTSVPGTTVLGVGATNKSSTGFMLYVTRTNTTDTNVSWVALNG